MSEMCDARNDATTTHARYKTFIKKILLFISDTKVMKKIFYFIFIVLLSILNVSHAQTVYSNTSSSLFYSSAQVSATTGLPIVYLDDVNIPSSVMGTTDSIDITAITFGFAKYGSQIPLWVDFYYSTVNGQATGLKDICTVPPVHFDSLFAYGRGVFGNLFKTFGDTVSTGNKLFRVKTVKNAIKKNYNSFFLGMSFSINSDPLLYTHGPLYTSGGTAANHSSTWYYDGVNGGKINKVNGIPGAFYLVVWGKPAGSAAAAMPLVASNATKSKKAVNITKWNVYPNPVNSNSCITVQIASATKIKVELYASTGQLVKVIDNGMVASGTFVIPLQLNSLAHGIYIMKLHAGNETSVKTIYL